MVTNDEVHKIVNAGAVYLDVHYPKWANAVKIEKIDVTEAHTSIATQVLGQDWDEEMAATRAFSNGFVFPPRTPPAVLEVANKFWRSEVRARRVGRPAKAASATV